MMAPTRGQRRAVILLLLLSVVLITLDHQGEAFRGVRNAAHSVVDPAQDGVTTLVAPVGRFFGGLGDLGDSGQKIDALQKENAELRRQLRESELSTTRSDELQKLKLLSGQGGFTVLPAVVTGLGPSIGFEWTVTVDAGRRDGLQADQTVIDSDGLVGRVKQVGESSAVVVLAVDPGSAVGVRVAGGNALGVAAGNGLGPLSYTPLDPSTRVQVASVLSPTPGPEQSQGRQPPRFPDHHAGSPGGGTALSGRPAQHRRTPRNAGRDPACGARPCSRHVHEARW